jgi:hypothetical protein
MLPLAKARCSSARTLRGFVVSVEAIHSSTGFVAGIHNPIHGSGDRIARRVPDFVAFLGARDSRIVAIAAGHFSGWLVAGVDDPMLRLCNLIAPSYKLMVLIPLFSRAFIVFWLRHQAALGILSNSTGLKCTVVVDESKLHLTGLE